MSAIVLRKLLTTAAALGLPLIAGGCVSLSGDGGMGAVQAVAGTELGKDAVKIGGEEEAAAAQERVGGLLRRPLTANTAVQAALLNNRGLQAQYNALGISEAQFVQASLPPNPRVSLSRLGGGFELEIERQLVLDVLALATLPARRDIAESEFKAAQLKAALATLQLAAETRKQFYRAVGANQQIAFLQQAKASADTLSELARKLGETGGLNKLNQAREYALSAEIGGQMARARLQSRIEREKLIRLLGLWGRETAFKLPSSLPPLPARAREMRAIEQEALTRRVDLQIARAELDMLAKSLGLTQATRFVNAIELAGISKYERSRSVTSDASGNPGLERERLTRRGLDVGLEIPLFDFGAARTAEAEQRYMQAANLLAEKAVNVRSQAREAYQAYRGTFDIARYYQTQILPLRKVIQEESLLHYNGMLQDIPQLVLDARASVLSNAQAIEARRDFWVAEAELHAALAGGGSGSSIPAGTGSAGASAATD